MALIYSTLPEAVRTAEILRGLQKRYVAGLAAFVGEMPIAKQWLRNKGECGGGERLSFLENTALAGASINFSQVHYRGDSGVRLAAATALSAIVHPAHPRLPSAHLHLSYTQMQDGDAYWRLMADLNPAIENEQQRMNFDRMLAAVADQHLLEGVENGEQYFYIPALDRHRGVSHFYLERFTLGDFDDDLSYVEQFGMAVLTTYVSILMDGMGEEKEPSEEEQASQLAYHTLYLFQVLLMDRGTTAGLLIHDQNDQGILGSLPPRVDKNLLSSWESRLTGPQDILLERLLRVMPQMGVVPVTDSLKKQFAETIRRFYHDFPEAVALQAKSPLDHQDRGLHGST